MRGARRTAAAGLLLVAVAAGCRRPAAAAGTGREAERPAVVAGSVTPGTLAMTPPPRPLAIARADGARQPTASDASAGPVVRPPFDQVDGALVPADAAWQPSPRTEGLWRTVSADGPAPARRRARPASPAGEQVEVLRGRERAGWRTVRGRSDDAVEVLRGRPDPRPGDGPDDGFAASAPVPFVDEGYPAPILDRGYASRWRPGLPVGGWGLGLGWPAAGPWTGGASPARPGRPPMPPGGRPGSAPPRSGGAAPPSAATFGVKARPPRG